MKFVVICELKWEMKIGLNSGLDLWLNLWRWGILIPWSQWSMYRYQLSKFTTFSLSICGDLDLEIWLFWNMAFELLESDFVGHWVVGKWFCLFSSIVGVSFIFYQKSKPCTSSLTNVFKVLFLFFTLKLFANFSSNSFPSSYYFHFSF